MISLSEDRDTNEEETAEKGSFDSRLALATLQSAMLINGGAAVAVLAFMGSIWEPGIVSNDLPNLLDNGLFMQALVTTELAHVTMAFSIGLLAAALGVMVLFLIQYLYSTSNNRMKLSRTFLGPWFFGCMILSFLAFFYGVHYFGQAFIKSSEYQLSILRN